MSSYHASIIDNYNQTNFSLKQSISNLQDFKIEKISVLKSHVDVNIVTNDILNIDAFKEWRTEYADADFIKEENGPEIFVHATGLQEEIRENDNVVFDVQEGKKGLNAINVKVI